MATKQTIRPPPDQSKALGPTNEELFEVLSNQRRRQALYYLLQRRDGGTTKRELSRQLAAWETQQSPEMVSSEERKRVYIALHQTHLPKLEDAGLVEYDSSTGAIELTDACDDLDGLFDTAEEQPVSWSKYYLGLGVVCLSVAGLVALGVSPFADLDGLIWAVVFPLLFVTTGAVHYWKRGDDQILDEGRFRSGGESNEESE
ncbi:DUF7344 domain-containing protein [Haloarchaeobius sp. TZWWS8]|uniref:DUF7344 domain-containing protein n=1 Tax=Haloarchaeobius sp. TZWWS8 TaxID=3446121 RepID=UPI003EB6F38C